MTPLPAGVRDALRRDLITRCFTQPDDSGPPRIGAEVELLALDAVTGAPASVALALLPMVRAFAHAHRWEEVAGAKGVSSFRFADGGRLTFEPGGQIEVSTAPAANVGSLVGALHTVVRPLIDNAREQGIALSSLGIDPVNAVETTTLQLTADRYTRMAAHFARIGPSGARMMRQTASIQVCVDLGDEPFTRWRLFNLAAPYFIASFANSSAYAGNDSGHASFRAHCWRTLDPARTGTHRSESGQVDAYLEFALDAPGILLGDASQPCVPMRAWVERGGVSEEAWQQHCSTLFPEVRPRGYLELRSCDAVDPAWYAAPLVLASGLAYDAHALAAATDLLAAADDDTLLERAGRLALEDPAIARTAADLWRIALDGAGRLPSLVDARSLEVARAFASRYVFRGLTLAAESRASARPASARVA